MHQDKRLEIVPEQFLSSRGMDTFWRSLAMGPRTKRDQGRRAWDRRMMLWKMGMVLPWMPLALMGRESR